MPSSHARWTWRTCSKRASISSSRSSSTISAFVTAMRVTSTSSPSMRSWRSWAGTATAASGLSACLRQNALPALLVDPVPQVVDGRRGFAEPPSRPGVPPPRPSLLLPEEGSRGRP